jgi:hypothetical protein
VKVCAPVSPLILCVAFLSASGPAAGAEQGGDFTTWSPPERRPEFRELVKGDEYARRMRAALATVDVPALEASKAPAVGLEITKVAEGSQAERKGIRAGDYILDLDGEPLAYSWQLGALRKDRTQTLLIHRADGSAKSVDVREGRIGIWQGTQWAPELEYVRGAKRSPEWEGDVLVGLTRQREDPPLAETAWHRAIAKGYEPDALSDETGAHIAASRGRYEEAMAFAWLALRADPKRTRSANLLAEIALASFKLDLGLRILKKHPELIQEDLSAVERLIADFRLHVRGKERMIRATELADRKERRNLLVAPKPLNSAAEFFLPYLQGGSATFTPPRGKGIPVVFGPAAADVEMVIRFSLEGVGDEENSCWLIAGWIDETCDDFETAKTCGHIHKGFGLEVNESKGAKVHHCVPEMQTTRIYHEVKVGKKKRNLLRLVVCDRQCEAVLNGLRLYHGPWPGDVRRLVPCLKVVGLRAWVHEISVSELTDDPAPDEEAGEDEVF